MMGDPFTLATGIAGLLSLSFEVIGSTRKYLHNFRRTNKDIEEFLSGLNALHDVLISLRKLLEIDRIWDNRFDRTSVLFLTYSGCEEKLREVRFKLRKKDERKFFKAALWPFEKEEHQRTVTMLHQWIQTFQFALTVDGWWDIQMLVQSND